MAPETDHNVLYFLADYEKYRQGKIDVLSSKSSVLICREKIKKIISLREEEQEYKTKVIRAANRLKLNINKYIKSLPRTRDAVSRVEVVKKPRPEAPRRQLRPTDEIRGELAEINRKLAELTGEGEEKEEFRV